MQLLWNDMRQSVVEYKLSVEFVSINRKKVNGRKFSHTQKHTQRMTRRSCLCCDIKK
jgi:hypothetical protein